MSKNRQARGKKQARKGKNAPRGGMDTTLGGPRRAMDGYQSFRAPRLHQFRRVFTESISGSSTGVVAYTPSVRLNQMPGFAEFTNLFSQYRLKMIQMTIRADSDILSVTQQYPTINMVYDPSSYTSLSGVTAAQQYETWRQIVFSFTKPQVVVKFKPNALETGAFVPGATSGTQISPPGQFFATGSSDIIFYGIKFITENLATSQSVSISYVCDWEFRIVS